jgi:hypothetical protein
VDLERGGGGGCAAKEGTHVPRDQQHASPGHSIVYELR